MSRWFLLKCKAREEKRAEDNLMNQGIESYRPMLQKNTVRRGKTITIVESLFPGYLFAQVDGEHANWTSIRSTRGVSDFVRFGKMPAVVTDDLIVQLKLREQYTASCIDNTLDFDRGERVKITQGCFSGLEAVFQCADGKERAIILLQLIGSERRVAIDKALLEKFA